MRASLNSLVSNLQPDQSLIAQLGVETAARVARATGLKPDQPLSAAALTRSYEFPDELVKDLRESPALSLVAAQPAKTQKTTLAAQTALRPNAPAVAGAHRHTMFSTLAGLVDRVAHGKAPLSELSPDGFHKQEWLDKIKDDWQALKDAPPALRRDKAVILAALEGSADAFHLLDADLKADPAFVLELIEKKPGVFRRLDAALLDDRDFVQAAIKANSLVLHGLYDLRPAWFATEAAILDLVSLSPVETWRVLHDRKNPLEENPDFWRKAVACNSLVAWGFTETQLANPEFIRWVVTERQWEVLTRLDASVVGQDQDVLTRIDQALQSGEINAWHVRGDLVQNPFLLSNILRSDCREFLNPATRQQVFADRALLAACLQKAPTLWRLCSPKEKELVQKELPAEAAKCLEWEKRLADLDLSFVAVRVRSFPAIEEVVRNRTTPDKDDPRPLAVCVYPKTDWNGAFVSNQLPELMRGHRVVYFEASTDTVLTDSIKQATANRPAAVLVLAGHGVKEALQLGEPFWLPPLGPLSPNFLDIWDEGKLQRAGLRDRVAAGARILLESCSVGSGRVGAHNLANMIGRLFPSAWVYSSTVPGGVCVELDKDNQITDVVADEGKDALYVVKPSA